MELLEDRRAEAFGETNERRDRTRVSPCALDDDDGIGRLGQDLRRPAHGLRVCHRSL
ncbi:hypothetical protein D3C83_298090 [compost metagenome]